jgi:hypothetical protein
MPCPIFLVTLMILKYQPLPTGWKVFSNILKRNYYCIAAFAWKQKETLLNGTCTLKIILPISFFKTIKLSDIIKELNKSTPFYRSASTLLLAGCSSAEPDSSSS